MATDRIHTIERERFCDIPSELEWYIAGSTVGVRKNRCDEINAVYASIAFSVLITVNLRKHRLVDKIEMAMLELRIAHDKVRFLHEGN